VDHWQYWININGQQAGPYSYEQIKQSLAEGRISYNDYICTSGSNAWVAIQEKPEFATQPVTSPSSSWQEQGGIFLKFVAGVVFALFGIFALGLGIFKYNAHTKKSSDQIRSPAQDFQWKAYQQIKLDEEAEEANRRKEEAKLEILDHDDEKIAAWGGVYPPNNPDATRRWKGTVKKVMILIDSAESYFKKEANSWSSTDSDSINKSRKKRIEAFIEERKTEIELILAELYDDNLLREDQIGLLEEAARTYFSSLKDEVRRKDEAIGLLGTFGPPSRTPWKSIRDDYSKLGTGESWYQGKEDPREFSFQVKFRAVTALALRKIIHLQL
jgi:hypothetical protein